MGKYKVTGHNYLTLCGVDIQIHVFLQILNNATHHLAEVKFMKSYMRLKLKEKNTKVK